MRFSSQMLPSLHVVHTLPLRLRSFHCVYKPNWVTNFLSVQGEKKKASHIPYEPQLFPLLEVQDLPAFAEHFGQVNRIKEIAGQQCVSSSVMSAAVPMMFKLMNLKSTGHFSFVQYVTARSNFAFQLQAKCLQSRKSCKSQSRRVMLGIQHGVRESRIWKLVRSASMLKTKILILSLQKSFKASESERLKMHASHEEAECMQACPCRPVTPSQTKSLSWWSLPWPFSLKKKASALQPQATVPRLVLLDCQSTRNCRQLSKKTAHKRLTCNARSGLCPAQNPQNSLSRLVFGKWEGRPSAFANCSKSHSFSWCLLWHCGSFLILCTCFVVTTGIKEKRSHKDNAHTSADVAASASANEFDDLYTTVVVLASEPTVMRKWRIRLWRQRERDWQQRWRERQTEAERHRQLFWRKIELRLLRISFVSSRTSLIAAGQQSTSCR